MSDFKFEVWPTEFRRITQLFGANPQNYAQFGLPGHEGLDLMAPTGSKIFAVAPGRVKMVETNPHKHAYGIHVRIEHQDGYETVYAHFQEAKVKVGDQVKAGDVIGLADNTGNSFGAHLHLTLKKQGAKMGNWPTGFVDPTPFLLPLMGWQRPAGPYTEGWAYTDGITIQGELAQANDNLNLRQQPNTNAVIIDLVPADTIMIVNGARLGLYTPVLVPTAALGEAEPTPTPPPPPPPPPTPTPVPPTSKDGILAWAWTQNLAVTGRQAVSGKYGSNLRNAPARTAVAMGLFVEGATAVIAGLPQGEYTPLYVRPADIQNQVSPLPAVKAPAPLPETTPPPVEKPTPPPTENTTAGWAFTTQIQVSGSQAIVGTYGINLRDAPRRSATNIGFVPANATLSVTGGAQGEYTPVLVRREVLQQSVTATAVTNTTQPPTQHNPDPSPLGNAKIGLHASADPTISDAEIREFAALRPGIIKLLSHHDPDGVRKLAQQHPNASWVVRAFLSFGDRNITPQQFYDYTISTVERTVSLLPNRDVVIELHNEPNLTPEGLIKSWPDGARFGQWWRQVLDLYRRQLPGFRFIYPGLSPGSSVKGLKQDHVEFIESSREAVKAADGLGVHIYWSNVYPMAQALAVLDDYIARFRETPIWITEASNNKGGVTPAEKGRQYIEFWAELRKRPSVQGVTYFVASALTPEFAEEVWVGRGIGAVVGSR